MNPALITRSGAYAETFAVSARSQASRLGWSATGTTKVGMPAASARASPATPGRSEPTATIARPKSGVTRGVDQGLQQRARARDQDHRRGCSVGARQVGGQRHRIRLVNSKGDDPLNPRRA